MDTAHITEILTDPVTLDLVKRQPITQIAYATLTGAHGQSRLATYCAMASSSFSRSPPRRRWQRCNATRGSPSPLTSTRHHAAYSSGEPPSFGRSPASPANILKRLSGRCQKISAPDSKSRCARSTTRWCASRSLRPGCGSTTSNAPHPARSNASCRPSRADPSDESPPRSRHIR